MLWPAIALVLALSAHAQGGRPLPGVDVDETRSVKLPVQIPRACVAIFLGTARVFIDTTELQSLAGLKQSDWHTEPERLAQIRANRAAVILASLAADPGADGCRSASSQLPPEGDFLVAELLEEGKAVVRDEHGAFAPIILVRYVGRRCGPLCGRGDILLSVPQSAPFLAISWWVS
jgi:hypothetical protein